MPTATEEAAAPTDADVTYSSAVRWLREHARDKATYPLVFEENVNYGFRRNMLAAKSVALALIAIGLVTTCVYVYLKHRFAITQIDTRLLISASIYLAAGSFWLLFVTRSWVKDAAESYTRALLASCEAIH